MTHIMKTLALLFALSLAAVAQTPPHELFVPANDVTLTIKTDRGTYKIGEQIKITYTVRNVSHGALYVPRQAWSATCPASPRIWAWFENSSGRHLVPGYAGSCSLKPSAVKERIQKEAALLKPGETFQDYFLLETRTFKDDLKPGHYRIEAAFSGWREDEFKAEQMSELKDLLHPLLRGETQAVTTIELQSASNP